MLGELGNKWAATPRDWSGWPVSREKIKSGTCVRGMLFRARIFKLLRSPRIDSKEPIPLGCVAWRAGTTTLLLFGSYSPQRVFKNSSTGKQFQASKHWDTRSQSCNRAAVRRNSYSQLM
jgi:hypothetical protein